MNVSLVSPRLSCNTYKLRHKSSRNRSRSWCFTINNHDKELVSHLSHPELWKMPIKKLIFQEEIGENETPHLQGFVMFKNQVDFSKIKEWLPTAHLEKAKSVAASIRYCSKKNTRSGIQYTFGILPSELSKTKLPPFTEEEIMQDMCKQMHQDINEDTDGYWKSHELDL